MKLINFFIAGFFLGAFLLISSAKFTSNLNSQLRRSCLLRFVDLVHFREQLKMLQAFNLRSVLCLILSISSTVGQDEGVSAIAACDW